MRVSQSKRTGIYSIPNSLKLNSCINEKRANQDNFHFNKNCKPLILISARPRQRYHMMSMDPVTMHSSQDHEKYKDKTAGSDNGVSARRRQMRKEARTQKLNVARHAEDLSRKTRDRWKENELTQQETTKPKEKEEGIKTPWSFRLGPTWVRKITRRPVLADWSSESAPIN